VQTRLPRALARALVGGADAAALQPMGVTREGLRMRADALARAVSNALLVADVAWARSLVDRANARVGDAPSPEVLLANARVLRSEGRRAKAGEALDRAQSEAGKGGALGLCLAERGDARESEGALEAAERAYEEAAGAAEASRDLAAWHGEAAFLPRMQSRWGAVKLQRKDVDGAVGLFQTALAGWRRTGSAFAEARVLANLGTALAMKKDFDSAQNAFAEAALAASRGGDLLFQAKQLIQLAKVLKRAGKTAELTPILREAKMVAARVFWDEGQAQAEQI
jgi:tetratricopeptide (TPR) repeat protein